MNRKDFFLKIQYQMNDVFVSQDPELLDTVFDIDGKQLYADKLRLSVISSTFKSMLSDRWNLNKNDAIKITTQKYEDFKELLNFIYSGKCNITDSNISTMIDMAEFYQIDDLKMYCDEYFSNMQITINNVFELIETSSKYLLVQMKNTLQYFVSQNFEEFLKLENFLNADEIFIKEFITSEPCFLKPEEIFEAVYAWAEHKATKKQKESNEENFNLNDAIKNEISDFLPYIPFKKMKFNSFMKHVVKNASIFSDDHFKAIIENFDFNFKVTISNTIGQSITGSLSYDSDAAAVIKALKYIESENVSENLVYWNTQCKIPSHPSLIQKREGVEWYLIYFFDGDIGARRTSMIDEYNYILAEMSAGRNGFEITYNCKIDIE